MRRRKKVQSKWNSTLNCDLNAEPVTTADSKPVRGRKKSNQNVNRDLWLIHQREAVFDALFSLLLPYCCHCADIVAIMLLFVHSINIMIIVGIYHHIYYSQCSYLSFISSRFIILILIYKKIFLNNNYNNKNHYYYNDNNKI